MKMSGGCEAQTDEGEECGHGMNDQDRREGPSGTRGKIEFVASGVIDIIWEQVLAYDHSEKSISIVRRTARVSYMDVCAHS